MPATTAAEREPAEAFGAHQQVTNLWFTPSTTQATAAQHQHGL
jgi:hypothetical protein